MRAKRSSTAALRQWRCSVPINQGCNSENLHLLHLIFSKKVVIADKFDVQLWKGW